jgi:hypothetical protein
MVQETINTGIVRSASASMLAQPQSKNTGLNYTGAEPKPPENDRYVATCLIKNLDQRYYRHIRLAHSTTWKSRSVIHFTKRPSRIRKDINLNNGFLTKFGL